MDHHQISQTLWLPPGTCLLNALPQYAQPTVPGVSSYHPTNHHVLKQQQIIPSTMPASSVLPNPTLLQQNLISPSQGYVQVPTYESILVTPDGKQIFEIPAYAPTNILPGVSLTLPNTTLLPPEVRKTPGISMGAKVIRKKRISPSAKRRSRMRLIAFLEAKKKQQEQEESTSENSTSPPLSTDDDKNLEEYEDADVKEDAVDESPSNPE